MKKINLAKPFIDKNDKKTVIDVLNSNVLSLGRKNYEFEIKFAKYLGVRYACTVANGTCGLHLAVKSLNIGRGDEVITTPFSFVASVNCILYEKAKPVFVDIEEKTFNIDPQKIETAITRKTKALLVVHVFGQATDMQPVVRIARKYDLKIIEDSCESLGAKYYNKPAGTFGNISVFAFYPNKQITTGEGGMIVTANKKLIDLCKSLRNQGRDENDNWLRHKRMGYNYRLSDLHAALGISQLNKLEFFIKKRSQIASQYTKLLTDIPGIITPKTAENRSHSWFVYVVRVLNNKRDYLMQKLAKSGIQTRSYFPVIHLQPYYKNMFQTKIGSFPIAEQISKETLALPFYVGLKLSDIKYIVSKIKNLLNEK